MTKLRVFRYDPEKNGGKPWYQTWDLDITNGDTVLDVLHEVHYFRDPTLSFRRSCNSAICGSCGMRLNKQARLACNTQALDLAEEYGEVLVEPLGNLRPLKDLVVDMGPFWQSVLDVRPFLMHQGKEPEGLYPVTKTQMDLTRIARDCIFCGACLSDCTSREANPAFLGPAALAKAFKFTGDPRDDSTKSRLALYSEPNGIWDCDTCLYCNEVCPMGVKPMDAILMMREMALEQGMDRTRGARHALAFYDTVMKSGKVNEAMTAVKSLGRRFVTDGGTVGITVRSLLKGKAPKPFKRPIRGIQDIRKLQASLEQSRRRSRA